MSIQVFISQAVLKQQSYTGVKYRSIPEKLNKLFIHSLQFITGKLQLHIKILLPRVSLILKLD